VVVTLLQQRKNITPAPASAAVRIDWNCDKMREKSRRAAEIVRSDYFASLAIRFVSRDTLRLAVLL
jgi:hypothetical protein